MVTSQRNRPQSQKLESPYKTPSNTLVVKELKAKRARSIDRIPNRMLGINFENSLIKLAYFGFQNLNISGALIIKMNEHSNGPKNCS